jgi:hypothetical protein
VAPELGEPLEMALVSVWRSVSQLPWLWRSVSQLPSASASRPT